MFSAPDIERAVLGGVLVDASAFYRVHGIAKNPDVFFSEFNREVYTACIDLSRRGGVIDMLTVSAELKKRGVAAKLAPSGSTVDYELAVLAQAVVSTAHLEYHIALLQEQYLRRKLHEYAAKLLGAVADDTSDTLELLSNARALLSELDGSVVGHNERLWGDVLNDMVQQVARLTDDPDSFQGITTGFPELDQVMGGFRPGELVVLAARPGMGKSSLAVAFAQSAMYKQKRVAFFSLEMSDVQIAKRFVSNNSNIHGNMLYRTGLDKEQYRQRFEDAVEQLRPMPLELIEASGIDVSTLHYKCMQIRDQRGGLDMVVVDYIQIMESANKGGKEIREQVISQISRGLKRIAMELQVPVIGLAQLSREVDKRGNKRPILSDLRESGAIEQDADVVMFIYNPEYYMRAGMMPEDPNQKGIAEVIVAKNRNGDVGSVDVRWDGNRTRFYPWQQSDVNQYSMNERKPQF